MITDTAQEGREVVSMKGTTELMEAASKDDAEAQCELAMAYLEGNEVGKDMGQALHWFNRAAEQGNTQAQVELGKIYMMGVGVQQDLVEAFRWIQSAYILNMTKQGLANRQESPEDPLSNFQLEITVRNLSEAKRWLASQMTLDQISEAQQRAIKFLFQIREQTLGLSISTTDVDRSTDRSPKNSSKN
jgi:TPR repeat protein